MKKLIGIVLAIAIIAAILFIFGGKFGFGLGNRNGNGAVESVEQDNNIDSEQAGVTESADSKEDNIDNTVKVSVAGNDYFYDNEKIELDTLIQKISEIEGHYVVEVKDEQASKNAYEALINALEDNGIAYTEK